MRLAGLGAVAVAGVLMFGCNHEQSVTAPDDAVLNRAVTADAVPVASNSSHGRTRSAPSTPSAEFEGTVKSAAAGSLVVTDVRRGDVTFTINGATVIRKGQAPVAITDLKAGDRVHVRAQKSNDAWIASLVIVQNTQNGGDDDGEHEAFEFEGVVKSLTDTALTLTTEHGDITLGVTSATTFQPAKPVAGNRVHVRAQKQGDSLVALLVMVQGGGEDHGGSVVEAEGIVTAAAGSSITVQTGRGSETVTIDAHTVITKQGKTIGAGDIKVGDAVEARGSRVDDHTMLAVQIEVHGGSGHHD
jgi:Domain of unknown function (DUF5666)